MKLKEGMYVRFVTGFDIKTDKPIVRIGKIENINDCCITINVFSRRIIVSLKEFEELKRKEPSNNIIDLIEVGDVIIYKHPAFEKKYVERIDSKECLELRKKFFKEKSLKLLTVISKEQFESIGYKVN